MTTAEMQRAMDFIVQQQAQSSAKIDALAEVQRRAEDRWTRTEESIHELLSRIRERRSRH